jgi:tellurite resistance protein TehA-like permease
VVVAVPVQHPAPTPASTLSSWHPGWTGAALGTAGVAAVGLADPVGGSPVDTWVGAAAAAIATVVLLVLLVLLLLRLVRHRDQAARDLANPGMGAQYGTGPAALLVVALTWTQLALLGWLPAGTAYAAAVVLVAGVALALVVGVGFFHGVVARDEVPTAAITGAWFVPIVVLVLVPSVVIRLVVLEPGWATSTALVLTAAAWGAGLSLFLLLAPIIGWRLLTASPPAAHAAPSWWIWLAPAGAGGVGAIAMTRLAALVVAEPAVTDVLPVLGLLVGTALWGFGLWWALLATRAVLAARAVAGGIPFHVGTWGFVFPSAAMTLLTVELGRSWGSAPITWLGAAFAVGVLVLWSVVSWLTVRGLRDRSILDR